MKCKVSEYFLEAAELVFNILFHLMIKIIAL